MSKVPKLYITGLVALSAIALVATSFVFSRPIASRIDIDRSVRRPTVDVMPLGIGFWIVVTLFASALPVQMPGGTHGRGVASPRSLRRWPSAGRPPRRWVALRGHDRAARSCAAASRGMARWRITPASFCQRWSRESSLELMSGDRDESCQSTSSRPWSGAAVYFALNVPGRSVTADAPHRRSRSQVVLLGDVAVIGANLFALAPLGWLMARMYASRCGWWATLLFALPLYTTRVAYHRFVEMREMFTQTIGALAEAVDKRDPFTASTASGSRRSRSTSGG